MKLSGSKHIVLAVGLMVAQLILHFAFYYLRSYISNNYGPWEGCSDFQSCLVAEEEMFESIFFYEIRALFTGLLTFIFCYYLLKKYKEKILMNVGGVVILSLSWVPALWIHWGGLRSHTFDVILLMVIGGTAAYYFINKQHIPRPSY